jgi:hypothetical protein
MRLLKFNGQNVDIDDKTAIGIDFQAFDVKDPGRRRVSISNNFTIPKTSNNLALIGFADDPQSLSDDIYDLIAVDFYHDNKRLIKQGNARITDISDRINVFVYEKQDFWALMADFSWSDFQDELILWLQAEKSLPSATAPFVGTWSDFISGYIDTDEGLIIPLFFGNLARYQESESDPFVEDTTMISLKYNPDTEIFGNGGHICCYIKTIFEFIEYKYGVNLSVTSEDYDYNIFEDVIASAMYVPVRNVTVQFTPTGFYFNTDHDSLFLPEKNTESYESKSLSDMVKAFFQTFNCIIDKVPTLDNSLSYIVRRFDDIINAPVIDFSGMFSGQWTFKPLIDGIKQVNYIKFSSVYPEGDELLNAKRIDCLNKNIDPGGSDSVLFEIDNYIPGQIQISGDTIADLTIADANKIFTFFISNGQSSIVVKATESGVTESDTFILQHAKIYSLDSEYNTFAAMMAKPKYYEWKKWLNLNQIDRIQFFARYWIKELGGYYFINKISGYNPDKSKESTTLELIKIPNQIGD